MKLIEYNVWDIPWYLQRKQGIGLYRYTWSNYCTMLWCLHILRQTSLCMLACRDLLGDIVYCVRQILLNSWAVAYLNYVESKLYTTFSQCSVTAAQAHGQPNPKASFPMFPFNSRVSPFSFQFFLMPAFLLNCLHFLPNFVCPVVNNNRSQMKRLIAKTSSVHFGLFEKTTQFKYDPSIIILWKMNTNCAS